MKLVKKIASLVKWCFVFYLAFIVYHLLFSSFLPVDENNVAQASVGYLLLGIIFSAIITWLLANKHKLQNIASNRKPVSNKIKPDTSQKFPCFQKKKKISPNDQAVIDNFRKSIDTMLNTPRRQITAEEYAKIREAERDWLENHYDFSSVEAVMAIPNRKDLPRPPGDSPTGDVYYHLHYRARCYADDMRYDLAIACQEKSNVLIKFRYGQQYGRKECYYLVKLYARAGLIDKALDEKEEIESFYGIPAPGSRDYDYAQNMIAVATRQGIDERDYAWIKENLPSMCPKSKTGFCRMRSQNTKNYQALKQAAAALGKEI